MSEKEIEEKIKRFVKQAAYNYKISQNEYNTTKGIYFKGKIKAYGECMKIIRKSK